MHSQLHNDPAVAVMMAALHLLEEIAEAGQPVIERKVDARTAIALAELALDTFDFEVREVREPISNFDEGATFGVRLATRRGPRIARCYVYSHGAQPFILQRSTMIKDRYTLAEQYHGERLQKEAPVLDGDVVFFNGAKWRVKVVGDYSDLGRLELI